MDFNSNKKQPKSNVDFVVMPPLAVPAARFYGEAKSTIQTPLVSSTTQTPPPIFAVPAPHGNGPFLMGLKEVLDEMTTNTKSPETKDILAVGETAKTRKKVRIPKSESEDSIFTKSLAEIIGERKILVPRKWKHGESKETPDIFSCPDSILDLPLDQIIKDRKIIAPGREGESTRKRKLKELMISDYVDLPISSIRGLENESYYVTPLHVIQSLMTTDGLDIEHAWGHSPKRDPCNNRVNWQSVISCGGISVTVNAASKELAKQAAAMRLICILKEIHPSFAYPKQCLIPEAVFYDLRHSIVLLSDYLRTQGLLADTTYYTSHGEKDKHDYFTTFINVGGVLEEPITGSAFNEDHSRLFAVKAAYETLIGKELPRGEFHVVKESRGKEERDADDIEEGENLDESETLHCININVEMMVPEGA